VAAEGAERFDEKKASAAMMAYCCEPGVGPYEIEDALQALSLREAEVPVLAATLGDGDGRVIFASNAMLALFRVGDLTQLSARLFAGHDPGAQRLVALSMALALDGAPWLGRLNFSLGPDAEAITFLCRRISGTDRELFVAAALGAKPSLLQAAPGDEAAPPAADAPRETSFEPILGLEDVRDILAARLGNRTNIRFLWRTDANDKITEITPPLAEVVGAEAADLLGRDFGDVAKYLEREPDGHLGRAFAKRETFSGVEVLWPVAGASAAVPVGLGGLPAFDRARQFDGYRGFGVIHIERLVAAEPRRFMETEAAPSASAEDPPAIDNVILLRRPPPPKPSAAELNEDTPLTDAQSEERGLLSFDERTAFQEIAQVLGEGTVAPAGEADTADHVEALSSSEAAAAPEHDPQKDLGRNAAAIFDRLGFGLLVSRDDIAIYANRYLLDLLGFADEDAFHAGGGMARMFEHPPAPGSDAIGVRTAAGDIVNVRARVQSIEWDHLPATLLTMRRDDEKDALSRLETELRIQRNEARELNAILDTATDGLAVLDSQGRIVTLNRSGEALFGYDQSEVAGKPLTVLMATESQAKVEDYFDGLRSNGVASLLNDGREIIGRARQGGLIPIFMTLGRIGLAQSDPAEQKFCALFRDMTHWKKVEQELEDARHEAERASALKSDFLAKVSHEIRTPLNAILGFAEVIIEERFGPIGNDRYRDYVKDIHTSGAHVMSLVNDLLDLSKIEAGKMDLDFISVDVNRAISECVAIMQPQANQARVIMRLAFAPHLPKIVADERSLRQILLNLLSNAVKFNEPGGQVIIATALTDGGNAVIRIRDTGIGMSDEDIATALEPFRRLATARQSAGTGLGLPLTKALVEANRAYFTIRSKKSEGTLVEVAFPPARVLAE
jgi:PAS domain S-box-containing protein